MATTRIIFVKIFLFLFFVTLYPQNEVIQKGNSYYLSNKIIVKVKESTTLTSEQLGASINTSFKQLNVKSLQKAFQKSSISLNKGVFDLSNIYILTIDTNEDPIRVSQIISRHKELEWAEPKYIHTLTNINPNDSIYALGIQRNLERIFAQEAWQITQGDTNVVIAIVDTGVDWNHPDLKKNILKDQNGNMIGIDLGGLDGNPDNDPTEDNAPAQYPFAYHGTHVAGIAGAVTNNNIGIASIGFNCKLLPIKASRSDRRDSGGRPFIYYGYEGIKYAADMGAKVINCSWGGYSFSRYEQEIINYALSKGALVVGAAGNENSTELFYPASYKGVLSVGWLNTDADRRNASANYGTRIDVMAPGTSIISTWPSFSGEKYRYASGSSLSAPLTSGLAALIFSKFPHYTPEQVARRIRSTCDDVSSVNNSDEKYLLGKGRINAGRALGTGSLISVTATEIVFYDNGNGNGLFESGETFDVSLTLTNYFRKINYLNVSATTSDPNINIVLLALNIGELDSLQTRANAYIFRFDIKENAPINHKVNIRIDYSTEDYEDFQWFTIKLNPTYETHNANKIRMTITSKGVIGFNDYPNNTEGEGLKFYDGENLLFEGAFMYGTSSTQLMDGARVSSSQSADFITQAPVTIKRPGELADEQGYAVFNDDGAGVSKLGITTKMYTYQFASIPDDNYIIIRTELNNNSSQNINGLYAGWYFDWDMPEDDYNDDVVGYDFINNFGYAYDNDGLPETVYVGAALVSSDRHGFYAIDQNDNTLPVQPNLNGFTDSEKWISISSGIAKTSAGPSDISFVISGGPFNIESGKSLDVVFALAVGYSLDEIKDAVIQSRQKYQEILFTDMKDVEEKPNTFELFQNYPNPFNPETKISYSIPNDSHVLLKIYDMLGREVLTLVDDYQKAGYHSLRFKAEKPYIEASGIYFYRIQAGNYISVKKMLYLK